MEYQEIIKTALKMRSMAYVPYSHFRVGSALLTGNGKVYTGCNIENAAYTPTNCAERTAFFKAVSEGYLKFAAIAVTGGKRGAEPDDYCPPCGVCLQVMCEFADAEEFMVLLVKDEAGTQYECRLLKELLPFGFTGKRIKE